MGDTGGPYVPANALKRVWLHPHWMSSDRGSERPANDEIK